MTVYLPATSELPNPDDQSWINNRAAPSDWSPLAEPSRNPYLAGSSVAAQALRGAVEQLAHSNVDILLQGEPGSGKTSIVYAIAFAAGCSAAAVAVRTIDGHIDAPLETYLSGPHRTAVPENGGRSPVAVNGIPNNSGPQSTILYIRNIDALAVKQREELATWVRVPRRRRVRILASIESDPTDHKSPQLDPMIERVLGVVRLSVPPLRYRKEDISPIAECWGRRRTASGSEVPTIEKAAIAVLRSWMWPENVTELLAVLDRAADTDVRRITPQRMRALISKFDGTTVAAQVRPLTEIELSYIRTAVERCGNNHTRAARLLGIGRSTLIRKLKGA